MSKGNIKNISKVQIALSEGQDRIAKPKEASFITGRSLASMRRDELAGRFPRKIQIGPRSVGYRLSELEGWLKSRETVTQETSKPVAVPGHGKRRGRPSKNATPTTAGQTSVTMEAPEIERFKRQMHKAGLKPLEDIIPDGVEHQIKFEDEFDESSCIVRGTYVLDLNYPVVGIYRCKEKNIFKRWSGKKRSAMSDQEKNDYYEKVKKMKRERQ